MVLLESHHHQFHHGWRMWWKQDHQGAVVGHGCATKENFHQGACAVGTVVWMWLLIGTIVGCVGLGAPSIGSVVEAYAGT